MMKKLLSLLVIVCMTVFCLSCHKDDNNKNNGNDNNSSPGTEDPSGGDDGGYDEGVYQPSKKIGRVTTTIHNNFGSSSSTTATAVYNWEDNLLKSINSNSLTNNDNPIEAVTNFTYENNRLVRIDVFSASLGHYYVVCQYEGDNLSVTNAYIEGQLSATHTYTYTNGRITKIEELYLNEKFCMVDKDLFEMLGIPGIDLIKYAGDAFSPKHPKTGSRSTVMLTWNNGNVTRVEATNNEDPDMRFTVEAEYDTYYNPFYGYFFAQIAASSAIISAISGRLNESSIASINYSKNNMKRVTVTNSNFVIVLQYNYTYEGAYRKTITYTSTTTYTSSTLNGYETSGVVEYEYLN